MVIIHAFYRIISSQHLQVFRLSVEVVCPWIQMRHFLPVPVAPLPFVVAVPLQRKHPFLRQKRLQYLQESGFSRTAVPGNTYGKGTVSSAVIGVAAHTVKIHADYQNQKNTNHQRKDNIPDSLVRLF